MLPVPSPLRQVPLFVLEPPSVLVGTLTVVGPDTGRTLVADHTGVDFDGSPAMISRNALMCTAPAEWDTDSW